MRGGSCLRDIRRPRPSPRQQRRLGHRRCGTCSVSEPSNTSNRPRQRRPGTLAIAMWVCHSHLLLSLCGFATAICYYRYVGSPQRTICYYRRSKLPFARLQRPKTLRGSFDQARRPQPSATIGVRSCRLPAFKGLKPSVAASTRHAGHSHLLLSAFEAAVCPPSKA